MMRADRLRELADVIEREDRFDYGMWVGKITPTGNDGFAFNDPIAWTSARHLGGCGTAGCVGGWGAYLASLDGEVTGPIPHVAQVWLGLTHAQAWRLFHGGVATDVYPGREWLDLSAVEVAKMLRRIADGEVVL